MKFYKYRKNAVLKKLKKYEPEVNGLDWSLIPYTMVHRIKPILERIGPHITWTHSGEVVLNNTLLPGSNISKLLLFHVSQNKKKSAPKFYKQLRSYFTPWHRY